MLLEKGTVQTQNKESTLGRPDGWAPVTPAASNLWTAVIPAYPDCGKHVGTCPVFLLYSPGQASVPYLTLQQDQSLVGSAYAGSHP